MKTFLIINTSFFGDILLTDPLCRNIKIKYPDSKIVFMVNKPFYQVAKYMDGVDQVLCYDKKGFNKGIKGLWKFYQEHKQTYANKIDAAFVIYGNERGIVLAKLLGAKKIYSDNQGIIRFLLDNRRIDYKEKKHTQDKHTFLFAQYTGERPQSLPMRYVPPEEARASVDKLFTAYGIDPNDSLIVLCTTSKRKDKDMDIAECAKLICMLHNEGKKVLFTGAGQVAIDYVNELHKNHCNDFIDFTNKTAITELAEVIRRCDLAVSVDTGTMHLICALGVPLVAVFYLNHQTHLDAWAPKSFYPHRLIAGNNFSAEFIMENINDLQQERH